MRAITVHASADETERSTPLANLRHLPSQAKVHSTIRKRLHREVLASFEFRSRYGGRLNRRPHLVTEVGGVIRFEIPRHFTGYLGLVSW